jgi:hypothetical protein
LSVCAAVVAMAAAGSATSTTNVPAIFTVKVNIYDSKLTMTPSHAVRGSTITFVLINRGKKTRTFQIGDVKRGTGHGQGFRQTLKPNQQFQKVMFLDYRGKLPFTTRAGSAIVGRGMFTIK